MNLYGATVTVSLVIPADNLETADTTLGGIRESLALEVDSMIKAENRAALSGEVKASRATNLGSVCARTLERLTSQLDMALED